MGKHKRLPHGERKAEHDAGIWRMLDEFKTSIEGIGTRTEADYDPELMRLAKLAVERRARRLAEYEAATPERRAAMKDEEMQGALAFLMDERIGGP